MKRSMLPGYRMFIVSVSLTLGMCAVHNARADNPKSSGVIQFSDATRQQATFTLGGTEKNIGRFTSYGELDFVPGAEQGTLDGTGVVVLTAANGDMLVGVATAQLDANASTGDFHFSWRDSVTLRDGTTVSNTGRFAKNRPPGLVVVYTTEQQGSILTILIKIILGR
jgi:hypothetical protein